jgi:hypothetical protein
VTLATVILVGLMAVPPSADARTTPYHPGGRITLDTRLLSKSGLSAWAIDEYLKSATSLPPLGSAFLDAERTYGVNARFLLAAALHESAWGTSYIARTRHNLFGYNAYDHCPSRCASPFDSYAASIDGVAAFMKETYLVPSGRWWGGAPTLRAMQKRWSSSGRWGENVSRVANSLHLGSLRARHVRFGRPSAVGVFHRGAPAAFDLGWKGRLPNGVTFLATWTPVLPEPEPGAPVSGIAPDLPISGATAEPTPPPPITPGVVPAPLAVKATETRATTSKVRLIVGAPPTPGSYHVSIEARDRDGSPLPTQDRPAIPEVDVVVWAERSVTYAMEPVPGLGYAITVTNMGVAAIPAAPADAPVVTPGPPIRGLIGSEPTAAPATTHLIVQRSFEPTDPVAATMVDRRLTEDLVPGASVVVVVPWHTTPDSPPIYLLAELRVLDDPAYFPSPSHGFWHPSATPDLAVNLLLRKQR